MVFPCPIAILPVYLLDCLLALAISMLVEGEP